MNMMWAARKQTGFTIVELLIVIVVIAILAAITIVAYNGIQTRATNTAIIQAAGQTVKLIKASNVANGEDYPFAGSVCATTDNACTSWNGTDASGSSNTTLLNKLKTVGTPISSVPHPSSIAYYGIYYNYRSGMTYNGRPARGLLMYWLSGEQQDCGLSGVVVQGTVTTDDPDPWKDATTTKWSTTGSGRTTCYIAINTM